MAFAIVPAGGNSTAHGPAEVDLAARQHDRDRPGCFHPLRGRR